MTSDKSSKPALYCDFCGKSQLEVTKLIAGPAVFICNECVSLCNDMITEDRRCGNCVYWELSAYGATNGLELGVGGPHCDGSVSNCRRNAPIGINAERDRIHDRAEWPTTRKDALCGAWQGRLPSQGIDARSGETGTGSIRQDESPAGEADAPGAVRGELLTGYGEE